MTHTPIYQVDAFAQAPFQGNPAAVCLLNQEADANWMQNIAAEMNLSETAFLFPKNESYGLRWFTPATEVDLCGHATLASAHILWETGALSPERPALFDTLSGRLTSTKNQDWIEMDFPAEPATKSALPDGMLQALGADPLYVGKYRMDYIVQLKDETCVKKLAPDFNALSKIQIRGIIVTAQSVDKKCDFISRFFAPGAGVNEDPVTGSAHCCLAEYWGERLKKNSLVGYQASKRGGWVKMKRSSGRVHLSGQAVTVLQGTLV